MQGYSFSNADDCVWSQSNLDELKPQFFDQIRPIVNISELDRKANGEIVNPTPMTIVADQNGANQLITFFEAKNCPSRCQLLSSERRL
jgi:hypothetical protein